MSQNASNTIQVVILAGGLGARLGRLAEHLPKPMIAVAGMPYLEHQIRLLSEQSYHNILVLTGHLGRKIEDYFQDGSRWKLSIRYSREPEPLGTGGALRHAEASLAESFLLLYGDSYLPINYRVPVEEFQTADTDVLMVVRAGHLDNGMVANNIALDRAGKRVIRYDKDNHFECDYVDAGVLVVRRTVIHRMPHRGQVSLEREVFPAVIADNQMAAHITQQRFYDIGTPHGLETLRRVLLK